MCSSDLYFSQHGERIMQNYRLLLPNSPIPQNISSKKGSKLFYNDQDAISRKEKFYPHYGASGIRRHTNLYRNGKSKGKLKKQTKLERNAKLDNVLSNHSKFHK